MSPPLDPRSGVPAPDALTAGLPRACRLAPLLALALAGCTAPAHYTQTQDAVVEALAEPAPASAAPAALPPEVASALLPPLSPPPLPPSAAPPEERFSVTLNNVPAAPFFLALSQDTPYSIVVPPEMTGTLSANLEDVTLLEALDAVAEQYGFDYTVSGRRIVLQPATLQTRIFQVDYLAGTRYGRSEIRVVSSSLAESGDTGGQGDQGGGGGGGNSQQTGNRDASRVVTDSTAEFWVELERALKTVIGGVEVANADGTPTLIELEKGRKQIVKPAILLQDGRQVTVNSHSGVIVVRAMPREMREVERFIEATQLAVGRQVILEAKILEVELNEQFQSGINWAVLVGGSERASLGVVTPGTTLGNNATGTTRLPTLPSAQSPITAFTGATLGAAATAGGGLFGLAFQSGDFSALLSFLDTQGTVHVLSSPRIATLNNQKAVLKVGVDEFFVTSVEQSTVAIGTTANTNASVELQPFFSGVVLDVTPQIDELGNIVLHVRPSVSAVTTVIKDLDLGTAGQLRLPLASSSSSETDSVVRARDGDVVAIGGLMRVGVVGDRSDVPGLGEVPVVGELGRQRDRQLQKRELVILIKPTVVRGSGDWQRDVEASQRRIEDINRLRRQEQW